MKVIFERKPYKLILQHKSDLKLIDLLKRTFWGTKETVYQHQHTKQNIDNVSDPFFFNLEKEGELIGTCCFSKRSTALNEQKFDVWYSRYFSIEATRQGGIFGHMIIKQIRSYFEKQTQSPTLFYAYVDASNIRSHKLLSYIGFKKIRSFKTLTFSRLYPKKDKGVSVLNTEDNNTMISLLNEAYKNHILSHFDTHFFNNNYFVLKKENEIVAGLRVNKAHWIIRSLAGFSGTLIIKFIPHIPIISRLFNPTNFTFAAFDGIYSKPGQEKDFFILMESVCAHLNVTTGIMWLDSESTMYHRLKGAGNWGIMNKLKGDIPAHVVAAYKNIAEADMEKICNCPVYISAIDII
jgi:RimJ/RimL family protein N-acetyltransferase